MSNSRSAFILVAAGFGLLVSTSVLAQPQVVPLGDGNVSVDMRGCSVLFNSRGGVVNQGNDCTGGDVREARRAFDSYQREQGASDAGGFRGFGSNSNSDFQSSGGNVTGYADFDYGGRSESFSGDVSNMSRSRVGNDSISSLRVPRGCSVTVYADYDYRGRSTTFTNDVPDMSRTAAGNDQISSLRVACGGSSSSSRSNGAVTLYSDFDYRGSSEAVSGDVRRMSDTRIGNDQVSSIRVPRGCEATLYSDFDFGGTSIRLDGDEPDMSRTRIGNDQISSIRVDCR